VSKRLFGTDGIRGVAGESPLDPATVRRFGMALGRVLAGERGEPGRVVLGRDTRESGPWLAAAVARGLDAAGAHAVDAGVITTPGLAHIVTTGGFAAGVMISASHNPFRDNGLKLFDHAGLKLSDRLEARVEEAIFASADPGEGGGVLERAPTLVRGYVAWLEGLVQPAGRFRGLSLALDCANGSATGIAGEVFRHHGAQVIEIGVAPDGRNINLDCGSLHLEGLSGAVRQAGCDLGIAFDGDADRALAVDRRGRVVDGDLILFIAARRRLREGRLRGNAVVATIMSNLWLERRLAALGIALHRAAVGDKYVLERLLDEDLLLGGEQSGHVIFREHATTGDGLVTGLELVDSLVEEPEPLEAILDGIVPCPQVHLTVRVRAKPDLRAHALIGPAVAALERELGTNGRLVLRYSGTEPVARVMVEGEDDRRVRGHAERLAELIRQELGA
jgi:phosphoglucosamine mutase